jgi:hypothetical protein
MEYFLAASYFRGRRMWASVYPLYEAKQGTPFHVWEAADL